MIKLYEDIKKDNEKYRLLLFVMLILCIILLIFLILSNLPGNNAYGSLNEDTRRDVEKLRWKHYGYERSLHSIDINNGAIGNVFINDSNFDYEWWSFYFEDGKFYVENQDGKWFIKMVKIDE